VKMLPTLAVVCLAFFITGMWGEGCAGSAAAVGGISGGGLGYDGAAIVLDTAPARTSVCLSGILTVRGYTPFRCSDLPGGSYRLTIEHPRFETRTLDVGLVAGDTLRLAFALAPKSRMSAAARSLVIPGWGQLYAGENRKGWTFICGEILAAGSAYLLRRNYQDEVERYEESVLRYEEATYVGDIVRLRQEVEKNYRNVERSHDYMNYATYVAAGIWAIAVIDAVVYDPAGVEVGVSAGRYSSVSSGGAAPEPMDFSLGVSIAFQWWPCH